MRKVNISLTLILLSAFVFGLFGLNTASAYYDAGCTGAGPYSTLSGALCDNNYGSQYYNNYYTGTTTTTTSNVIIPGCYGYTQYSTTSGQPCSQYQYGQSNYTQPSYNFTQELERGSRGQDVVMLQQILKDIGYFFGRVDGVFGSITRRAVVDYQTDNGLAVTGRADFDTLASLNTNSSGIPPTVPPCPLSYVNGIPTNNCGGYGSVPTVSGVSGPQTLSVNQLGSWSVSAYDQSGGVLNYSVNWGDYQYYPYNTSNYFAQPISQQNATFTHTYTTAGTYRPVFTVTNQSGQTAQTTLTVVVGLNTVNNYGSPYIYSLSPASGPVGSYVTINGSGFTSTGNIIKFGDLGTEYNPNYNASSNGTSIVFTVPSSNYYACQNSFPTCYPPNHFTAPGTYAVSVTNANGATSNVMYFTVQ